MAEITAAMVKELRAATGAGVLDCKKALNDADGDFDAAVEALRKKGLSAAAKKSSRATREGSIGHYIHPGAKMASLVEVACETDFVARTEQFQQLVADLAMHVVASRPEYVSREDVPAEAIEKEKAIFMEQAANSGKPDHILERIVEGQINKWLSEICLVEQPFVKNPDVTIQSLITDQIVRGQEGDRKTVVAPIMNHGKMPIEKN